MHVSLLFCFSVYSFLIFAACGHGYRLLWPCRFHPLETELEQLEAQARDAKIGLWVDPAPIPPWGVIRQAWRILTPNFLTTTRHFSSLTSHGHC